MKKQKNILTCRFARIDLLLRSVGIDVESFLSFTEWALSEQLVEKLSKNGTIQEKGFFTKSNALRQFRNITRSSTGREWSVHDLGLLYDAVKNKSEENFRRPVTYGEYLKLLWTAPLRCAKCGKEPPSVKLHIDHIIPVSLGGTSDSSNIQFLCMECNLKKSNKLEGDKPWMDLL